MSRCFAGRHEVDFGKGPTDRRFVPPVDKFQKFVSVFFVSTNLQESREAFQAFAGCRGDDRGAGGKRGHWEEDRQGEAPQAMNRLGHAKCSEAPWMATIGAGRVFGASSRPRRIPCRVKVCRTRGRSPWHVFLFSQATYAISNKRLVGCYKCRGIGGRYGCHARITMLYCIVFFCKYASTFFCRHFVHGFCLVWTFFLVRPCAFVFASYKGSIHLNMGRDP